MQINNKMRTTPIEKYKLLMEDPIRWIESFVKLADKKGKIVPFYLNKVQKSFLNELEDYNIILKSRQMGLSVSVCGLALYYSITQPNTDCLLLSHTDESTRKIFNKLKTMYKHIPDVIKPKLIRNNRQELAFTNGSTISCHTMGKRDVGRGSTLKLIHVSEWAFVGDQAEKQILSLEQALVPSGKLIIESTANSLNHMYDKYFQAKNGENSYKSFFYNYVDGKEMFIDDYEKAVKIWKARHNGKMITMEELNDDELELMKQYPEYTLDMIVWRRLKIANTSVDEFNQEFPIDDICAFINSGANVFNNEKIESRSKYLPNPFKKNEIKRELPSILQKYCGSSFFMWNNVEPGMKYYIGVDSAEGLGGKSDYSVVEVFDKNGLQCAEFSSNKIKPYKFAEIVYDLACYFNNGYLVIEKASAGHSVIDKLRHEYKYLNMHKSKQYDERGKVKKKVGFDTNTKSRPILIADFTEAFDKGEILINSKRVLEEMKSFTEINGKLQARQGAHDDHLFACFLAIAGIKAGIWYI